jgi:hypothetical protein
MRVMGRILRIASRNAILEIFDEAYSERRKEMGADLL